MGVLQYWDTIIAVAGPLLGLLGGWLWKGKREATKAEIERWSRVATDFVLSLIARGVIPAEEAVVMDAWVKRFQYLLSLIGLQVSTGQLAKARAVALERIGEVLLVQAQQKLGAEAEKLLRDIHGMMNRRAPTAS